MLRNFFVLLFATATSGCATLFSDGSQRIKVTSNVDGASVLLDAEPIGRTPLEFELDRDTFARHELTLTAQGYESETVNIKKNLNTTALFNCTSVFSWSTDAISGNMMEYSPGAYYVELHRESGRAPLEQRQLAYFVILNRQHFLIDVSKRRGEYLSTVARLAGVDAAGFPAFAEGLARRLPAMAREPYPHLLLRHIEQVRVSQAFVSQALAPDVPRYFAGWQTPPLQVALAGTSQSQSTWGQPAASQAAVYASMPALPQ
ncbi:MAG TPA: PEGA domain-containing protein [Polyangiaceae bacterium]